MRTRGNAAVLIVLTLGAALVSGSCSPAIEDPLPSVPVEPAPPLPDPEIIVLAPPVAEPEPHREPRALQPRSPKPEREPHFYDRALVWLEARQEEDGSWGGRPRTTGIVLLAFLAGGESHKHGRYKKVVREGLKRLKEMQDEEGWFVCPGRGRDAHGHVLGALAMCNAYGLTSSPLFKECAQKAVRATEWLFDPGGVQLPPEYQDPSLAVWASLVLESARISGLEVQARALKRCAACFEYGGPLGALPAFAPSTPGALLAGEIVVRFHAGARRGKDEKFDAVVRRFLELPVVKASADGWLLSAMALHRLGGTNLKGHGGWWRAFRKRVHPRLGREDSGLASAWLSDVEATAISLFAEANFHTHYHYGLGWR